jgi:4-amino-4-deoxy-L-arabinose transferase-like glycosyltransferase
MVLLARILPALVALSLAVVTVVISLTRFIARDEGFYLYAAKLILLGQIPYRDFFLPQMPLMPYLYAGWFWVFGTSWIAARLCAALIAIGSIVVVYLLARYIYGERSARLAVLLLSASAAFQVWVPLAKNTGLACFLFLLALYSSLVSRRYALAGLCMGLCIISRLTFGPLAILLFIPRSREAFLPQLLRVSMGMLPAAALTGWWYGLSPDNFILDNIGYHFQRSRLDEDGIADNKNHVFLALLGIKYCVGGGGRQFCLFLLGGVASIFCKARGRFEHRILVTSAAMFFVLNFIPSPTYVQYFCVVAALAAAPSAHCFLSACDWIRARTGIRYAAAVSAVLGILFFSWLGSLDMYRFLFSGEKVIGVGGPNHNAWRLHVPSEIAQKIDNLNTHNKPVYVSWPGYLLEARSPALPGTENNFGVGWANNLGLEGEEARARRVLGRTEIADAIGDKRVDVVALFLGRGRKNGLEDLIEPHGVRRVENYKGIVLYSRNASQSVIHK